MRRQWGFLAVVLVLAGCGVAPKTAAGDPGIASETKAVPVPAPTGPGDMAPHEIENRGWVEPSDLSEETLNRLLADAPKLRAKLRNVQAAHDYRPESTAAVLVAAGYPKDKVFTARPNAGTGVVFGVPDGDGCLVGSLGPGGVGVVARAPIKGWGCGTPDAH